MRPRVSGLDAAPLGAARFLPAGCAMTWRREAVTSWSKFKYGMVADAVVIEPVSTPEFPANREKNREFYNFEAVQRIRGLASSMIPGRLGPNSLLKGTGNFSSGTGNYFQRTGNFACENAKTVSVHWIKMRRSLARFSVPDSLIHTRSLVGFITTTSGFRFSVHTRLVVDPPGV